MARDTPERHDRPIPPRRKSQLVRSALLACGVLSTMLYAGTDLLGAMRYPGYSITSQAISELMATDAPSKTFVDPLFITYDLLMLAFGITVFAEGASRSRALRITGALLIAYAAARLTGPTLFGMNPRGATNDLGHIVLTEVLILLMLGVIAFGAFTFGQQLRLYSLATLIIVVAFATASAPYGARLAAGEPTPGFGIVDRINVYSSLLWIAVFAVALLRHASRRSATVTRAAVASGVHDMVAPILEEGARSSSEASPHVVRSAPRSRRAGAARK